MYYTSDVYHTRLPEPNTRRAAPCVASSPRDTRPGRRTRGRGTGRKQCVDAIADAERRDGRQRHPRDHATIRARGERAASGRRRAIGAREARQARGVKSMSAGQSRTRAIEVV